MAAEVTDDQALLIQATREFARGELLERDRAWDADESPMTEVLPQLAEMGLMSLTLSEELGGLGCSYRVYADILHELSYASPSVAVAMSVHNMVGQILDQYTPEPSRTELLSTWGTPESFGAFAVTEAGAGSDLGGAKTEAARVDGGYRITGEKMGTVIPIDLAALPTAEEALFMAVRLGGLPSAGELR